MVDVRPWVQEVLDRVPRRARDAGDVLVETYEAWRDDRCVRLGAGLAYYGLFAIVPLLTLAVAIAGLVFTTADVQSFIAEPLARLFGEDVEAMAARVADELTGGGLVAQFGLAGFVSLLVASSLVFVAFQDALNQIWHLPYRSGLRRSIRRRLLSFAVVVATGGVLILSLAAQAVVGALGGLLPVEGTVLGVVTNVASGLLTVVVAAVALALLLGMLPQADVDRRAALAAGTVTALVMAASVVVVGAYLRRFGTSSAQGAAGSVFVVLTAIYAQAQVVLVGAELTKVLTWRRRGTIRQSPATGEVADGVDGSD